MTKDNLISAVFGILLGFIAGYLLHEVMASRQPPRFAGNVPGGPTMAGSPGTTAGGPQAGSQQQEMAAAQAMQQEMQQLEQFIQQNPNDVEALRRLGDLNFEQARWPQARDFYSRVLQLEPGNADVLSDLGVAYRGLKDYPQALAQFDEAQRLVPDHWQSRFNEAVVLAFDLERYDEAEQVVRELEKLQPGNPNVARLVQELQKRRQGT